MWETRPGDLVMKPISFSCPVCGKKKDYPVEELFEGAILQCSFCKLTLVLHGHMWEDVQREIQRIRKKMDNLPSSP